jgi:hypothetical protein
MLNKSNKIKWIWILGSEAVRSQMNDQRQNINNIFMALLILGLVLTLAACGKKGPPFLPQKTFGAKVVNLLALFQDGSVILKGRLQGINGVENPESQVSGCRVYYAEYPLDKKPCPDCPLELREHREFGPEIINAEGFFCQIPGIKVGQIYYFKVLLIGPDGSMGPVSDRISIEVR